MTNSDVLIVGAGPTGLTLAVDLTRRGIACRIIDKNLQRSPHSRALVVHARSLEIFYHLGIAQQFLNLGQTSTRIAPHFKGKLITAIQMLSSEFPGTQFPFVLTLSQYQTETLLEAELNRLGVQVNMGYTLSSLTKGPDHCQTVVIDPSGEKISQRYAYVVGCDGAHSQVRRSSDIKFEGAPYRQDFVLADVDIHWREKNAISDDSVAIFADKQGVLALFPIPGSQSYRIISSRPTQAIENQVAPTLDEIQDLFDRFVSYGAQLKHPKWLARFNLHHRVAQRYQCGRVFIAGDAAHIHSPAGGQGMNTGIQDAWNLSWKLACVIKQQHRGEILNSYNAERRPVGLLLLKTTDRMFQALVSEQPIIRWLRLNLVPKLLRHGSGNRHIRRKMFKLISQLGVAYSDSPLNLKDDKKQFSSGIKPGERAADATVRFNHKNFPFFKWVDTQKYTLILFAHHLSDHNINQTKAQLAQQIENYPITLRIISTCSEGTYPTDNNGELHRYYGIRQPSLYLIRPDGHVISRLGNTNLVAFQNQLKQIFDV